MEVHKTNLKHKFNLLQFDAYIFDKQYWYNQTMKFHFKNSNEKKPT